MPLLAFVHLSRAGVANQWSCHRSCVLIDCTRLTVPIRGFHKDRFEEKIRYSVIVSTKNYKHFCFIFSVQVCRVPHIDGQNTAGGTKFSNEVILTK